MWWSRKALEKSRDIRRKCIPYFTSSLISSTNALSIGYISLFYLSLWTFHMVALPRTHSHQILELNIGMPSSLSLAIFGFLDGTIVVGMVWGTGY